MKIVLSISGRSRISDVKPNVRYLLENVPTRLRRPGIEVVGSLNWAHEPQTGDSAFLKELRGSGLVSHCSWTPTFFGVGEVMFDAIFQGFAATPDADFALHLPTDSELSGNLENSVLWNLDTFLTALEESPRPDLVLGDYSPRDSRTGREDVMKTRLEAHVRRLVKHFFPREWGGLNAVRRLRTEFFVVGRDFFTHLTTATASWSVFDPIVIALVEAVRDSVWAWKRVDLGVFYEKQRRDERAIVRQIHRTTYALSSYWLTGLSEGSVALELAEKLAGAIAIETESLRAVKAWINEVNEAASR